MDHRSERGFEVVVTPGFPVTMICLVVVYSGFHALNIRHQGDPAFLLQALNWGAAVTVLILLGTLVHELGHVLAGLAAGHRWTKAILNGAGLGVVLEPRPYGRDRVLRSLAGPFAHLLFALPLLAWPILTSPSGQLTVAEAEASIWWVSGVGSLFLALLNALPIPGLDGAKVLAGLRELRGPAGLATVPERSVRPAVAGEPSGPATD